MNVKFNIVGLEKVQEFMKSVPKGVKAAAMRAIAEFIIGNKQHGLRHYPSYKYITRKQAGYTTSDRQRRFLFASGIWQTDSQGNVMVKKYNRTGAFGRSWRMEQKGSQWDRTNIMGNIPFEGWPANMNRMGGWRKVMDVVKSNLQGAVKRGQEAVNRWIKEKGFSK